MMASTSAAGAIPGPARLVPKKGIQPSAWCSQSLTGRMAGTTKKIPHNPETTLGMAARSSTMVRNTCASRGGRKSWVRKIAIATPKKPPIASARSELYSVPQIAGRMPNCCLLTSQVVPTRRSRPCFCIPGTALRPISQSSAAMTARIITTASAASARNARSMKKSTREGGAETDPGAPGNSSAATVRVALLDVGRRLAHFGDDALRKRDIAHLVGDLLPVGEAVFDQRAHRSRLFRICVLLVEDQPGIARDGVGLGAVGVGQPGDHVGGQLGGRERVGAAA